MEGRKLIIQMTIAGMTQYLTKVQGMLKEIEDKLIKKTRNFLWNKEGIPPVNELTLQSPISEGGRKVLDLNARNKAIQLTWLKSYLNMGKQRPTWAYIADEIIRKNILTNQQNVENRSRINTFLQSWRPNKSKLPQELKEMLKTAEEFNVKIKTLKPTKDLQNALPIWFYKGGNGLLNVLYSYKEAKCLRTKHKIITTGQLNAIALETSNNHKARKNCPCNTCKAIRDKTKCKNPHSCQIAVRKMINTLNPKWNPNTIYSNDNLDLTPRRIRANKEAETQNNPIIFNPKISTNKIKQMFRIFTEEIMKNQNQQ